MVIRDRDRADRRGDNAPTVAADFHAESAPDPRHLEEASTEARTVQVSWGHVREELTALNQDSRVGGLKDDDPVKSILRADVQRGDGFELANLHSSDERDLLGKPVKSPPAGHEQISPLCRELEIGAFAKVLGGHSFDYYMPVCLKQDPPSRDNSTLPARVICARSCAGPAVLDDRETQSDCVHRPTGRRRRPCPPDMSPVKALARPQAPGRVS